MTHRGFVEAYNNLDALRAAPQPEQPKGGNAKAQPPVTFKGNPR